MTNKSLFIMLFFTFCFPAIGLSQNRNNKRSDNGIGVSEPKPFDNRSLTLKLEELDKALSAIQVIDPKRLAQSLGLLQGYQSRDTARSFEVGMLPIPGLKTNSKTTSDTDAEGRTKTGETNEVTSERKEYSYGSPTTPDLLAVPNNNLGINNNAETMLTEQLNLMYQRFSLQMMLERSFSDRLLDNGTTRLQAVIGFNFDLTPPEDAKNKSAVIEVTIEKVNEDINQGVSLVAMMPQEKTYNTYKVSNKSNSFGGAAVIKVFTVGYSERRRGQTFYLYQDADTITFQKRNDGSSLNNTPTFGWQFNPVLGRESVSQGMRQMFAVIALPNEDTVPMAGSKITISGKIRTYWRKYNHSRQTSGDTEYDERTYDFKNVKIPITSESQNNLKPQISSIEWVATDNENASVIINGKNLFTGTNVTIGNRVHSTPETGLFFKSDQSLMIRTPLAGLINGDAVINGRYGDASVLEAKLATPGPGVQIHDIEYKTQTSGKISNLSIKLTGKDFTNLTLGDLPKGKLLIGVGNSVVFPNSYFQNTVCERTVKPNEPMKRSCVMIQVSVPSELLANDVLISIKYPFQGDLWRDALPLAKTASTNPLQLTRLGGSDASTTTIAISGRAFYSDNNNEWKILLDKIYAPEISCINANTGCLQISQNNLLIFTIPSSILKDYKSLLVLPPYDDSTPIPLQLTSGTNTPVPKPKLNDGQKVEIEQNNNIGVKFTGENLTLIRDVTFGNLSLPRSISKNGAEMTIYLIPPVTQNKGQIQLLLMSDGNDPIPATIIIK